MSSKDKNLSEVSLKDIKQNIISKSKIAIIRSHWNEQITLALEEGCISYLEQQGLSNKHIKKFVVSGSFELIHAAAHLALYKSFDAIICIGCIIKGETPHFDYISQAVSIGLAQINAQGTVPVVFGVLTTDDIRQATERAGGKHGNKGIEAAATALQMIQFKSSC
jgi:6,7-dimethyl-8-ribityllumazine synthase